MGAKVALINTVMIKVTHGYLLTLNEYMDQRQTPGMGDFYFEAERNA